MRRLFTNLLLGLALIFSATQARANTDPGVGGPTTKSILYGGSATLWPDFQNGTATIDNGVGTVTTGAPYTVNPLVTTTYTLTITSLSGDTATGQVTVNVATVTMTPITPANGYVTVGHVKAFSTTVSGAVDPSVAWFVDGIAGGNASIGTIDASGNYTAPAAPGTHTISATSNANVAVQVSTGITVVAAPTITGVLTATPASITYGGTSVLSATFTGGTATLVGGATNTTPTSPVNFTTPALVATTQYTLTVTDLAGDFVTGTVTVTVSTVAMTPLAVTNAYVSQSGTGATNNVRTITGGVVSGAADPSVTWQVNGVAGGNATYGTIDTTGHYTAPAVVPGTPAVTITCMSNEENAIVQTITLTIVPLPTVTSFTVN